ncbi:MAG: thermonuclease family protein [Defluviicoccus sp.]|nr:thermonuclease family protein [Defluviicoccus sp.]MDE0278033.1 thermonuclease family protein [Defluviicoccus sp.]
MRAIPLVIVAGAIASLPPSIWLDARATIRLDGVLLRDLIEPTEAQGAARLVGPTYTLRDSVSAIEDEYLAAVEPRNDAIQARIVRVAAALSGRARAINGDTLVLSGARIRLHDIDAPERVQNYRSRTLPWACGWEATGALAKLIRGKSVSCQERDRDRYGRVVAVCVVAGQVRNVGNRRARACL